MIETLADIKNQKTRQFQLVLIGSIANYFQINRKGKRYKNKK